MNIKLNSNFYFIVVITFMLVIDKSYYCILSILFALLHELGHILIILLKNLRVSKIKFGIINIDMIYDNSSFLNINYKDEFLIYISGPFVNFVLYLMFIFVYCVNNIYIFKIMAYQNFFLGIINLLPIESLDGYKILSLVLSRKFDINTCEKILNIISIIFLVPVSILGFMILIKSKYNFSLLIFGVYLFSRIILKKFNLE